MIFRITSKLGKKIRLAPSKVLPPDENPYADWSAHLFTAGRAQYILITNTASLYSMVMYGRGITDDFIFLDRVTDYMGEFIRDDGHRFLFERLVAPSMARVSFSKALNRAVTGSMNDLVFQAKTYLSDGTASPFDVSFKLNETPLSYLKHSNPREAFKALAISLTHSSH
ncbi:MAG: hypothetical protein HYV04_16805 [Deltaproteobacteria bacterium]|nr:hypothetical protein [Deltaproteobacteria bacterium]